MRVTRVVKACCETVTRSPLKKLREVPRGLLDSNNAILIWQYSIQMKRSLAR